MAEVMQILGIQHALIVHGEGGFDEITPCGLTTIADVTQAGIETWTFDPADVGIARAPASALAGADATENASIIRRIFEGETGAPRDAVVLNAAAALAVCGQAEDIASGVALAAEAIDSGRAQAVLQAVAAAAQSAAEGAA